MTRAAGCARAAATGGGALALDQITKAVAKSSLERGESVNVFLGLDITNGRNSGVAFGALQGRASLVGVLIAIALVSLVVWFALNAARPWLWLPVGLVLGGALGNLTDRLRQGAVTDFIDPIVWPAFNLADTLIVIGVVGLLYVVEGPGRRE